MVNTSTAIVPYRPQQDHFIVSKMKACENIPALKTSTTSANLVLYEKRLPERSFMSERTIEMAVLEGSEIRDDLPKKKDNVGYGLQGHLILQGRTGLLIDFYI